MHSSDGGGDREWKRRLVAVAEDPPYVFRDTHPALSSEDRPLDRATREPH